MKKNIRVLKKDLITDDGHIIKSGRKVEVTYLGDGKEKFLVNILCNIMDERTCEITGKTKIYNVDKYKYLCYINKSDNPYIFEEPHVEDLYTYDEPYTLDMLYNYRDWRCPFTYDAEFFGVDFEDSTDDEVPYFNEPSKERE